MKALITALCLVGLGAAAEAQRLDSAIEPFDGRSHFHSQAPTHETGALSDDPTAIERRAIKGAVTRGSEWPVTHSVCPEIAWAAATYNLPPRFLANLIWQESRFDPRALSRAGARGIAQFMPATAQWRGLADPFNPSHSIWEAARWLGELRSQFGNLGLAAAAYNAGPQRIADWLAQKRSLPAETIAYVRIVTGWPAHEWARYGRFLEAQVWPIPKGLACHLSDATLMAAAPSDVGFVSAAVAPAAPEGQQQRERPDLGPAIAEHQPEAGNRPPERPVRLPDLALRLPESATRLPHIAALPESKKRLPDGAKRTSSRTRQSPQTSPQTRLALLNKEKEARSGPSSPTAEKPTGWSLQLIGDKSKAKALAEYKTLQKKFPAVLGTRQPVVMARQLGGRPPAVWYQIRVAENTRSGAESLCARLKSSGGDCLVVGN